MRKQTLHTLLAICLIWTAGFFMVSVQACGKKGDPVPLRLVPPPAVTDLKAALVKGSVHLSWTMPDGKMDIARIRMMRSSLEIAGDECTGCPRKYEPVDDVSPRDSKIAGEAGQGVRYVDGGVKAGRLYTYKIILCDSYGNCGGDSNAAEIKVKE